MSPLSYVNNDLNLRRVTGTAVNMAAAEKYLALLEELGYNPSLKNLDLATFSKNFSHLRSIQQFGIEDSNYILNLKQYDFEHKGISGTDSFYISCYDNQGSYVDQAFGWSDLTGGFNSVESYINPFDFAVIKTLEDFYAKNKFSSKTTADQKIAALYNYVINNFSYIQEQKDDWNFAGETIFQRGGDCEDLSILMASLGMALLIDEGVSYAEANKRFSVVAGRDQKYGDHVYVEYAAEDGTVYVVDPATALQGNISGIKELNRAADNSGFEVYFRFNDASVVKETAVQADNKSYIDPNDSDIQKIFSRLKQSGVITEDMNAEQLALALFNYFKNNFSYVSKQTSINYNAAAETGLLGSETFSYMMMSLFLAGLKDLGLDISNFGDAHVGLFKDKKSGSLEYAFVYQDRVFDLSQKITGKKNAEYFLDLPKIGSLSADEIQTFDQESNVYQRSVTRFNPQYGSFLAQHMGVASKNNIQPWMLEDLKSDPLSRIGGMSDADYFSGMMTSGYNAWQIVSNLNVMYPALHKNFNDGYKGDIPAPNAGNDVSKNIKLGIGRAIGNMANFKDYIVDMGGFWYFNDYGYNANLLNLNFYQNLVSMLGVLHENKMNSYNTVISEMNDSDPSLEGREGYKSMNPASLIKNENESLSKGATAMRDDVKNMVSAHNEQLKTLAEKYLNEELTKKITGSSITTLISVLGAGVITFIFTKLLAVIIHYLGVALAAIPFTAAAGIALQATSAALSMGVVGTMFAVFLKMSSQIIAFQKMSTEWVKYNNLKKKAEINGWALNANTLGMASAGASAGLFAGQKARRNGYFEAKAVSGLYSSLAGLSAINFRGANDSFGWGVSGNFKYENDAVVEDYLAEMRRTSLYIKARNKIREESMKARSVVHQELTGKSSVTASSLSEEGINRELAQVEQMANRIVEVRKQWIATQNSKEKAMIETRVQLTKCIVTTAAMLIGFVLDCMPAVIGSGTVMAIAQFANTLTEFMTETNYNPPMVGMAGSFTQSQNFNIGRLVTGSRYGDINEPKYQSAWTRVGVILSSGVPVYGAGMGGLGGIDSFGYGFVNRGLFDAARSEVVTMANLQRMKIVVSHYHMEARNIVHQEMTSTPSYTQSGLAEEAVAKEAQYLLGVLGAMQSRLEFKRQTLNERTTKQNAFGKQMLQLGMGIAAGFLALIPVVGLLIGMAVFYMSTWAPIIYDSANPYAETKIGRFMGYDAFLYSFNVNMGMGMSKTQYFPNSIVLGQVVTNIMNQGVPVQIMGAVHGSKAEARAMIHQELTNVSGAGQADSAKTAVQAKSQLYAIQAANLNKTVADVKALKQKRADAEYENKWVQIKGLTLLGVYAGLLLISKFVLDIPLTPAEGAKNAMTAGAWASMCHAFTNITSMAVDITRGIMELAARPDEYVNRIMTANLNISKTVNAVSQNNKYRRKSGNGAMAAAETTQNSYGIADDPNNPSSVMAAQARYKQMEKIKEAIIKVAKASRAARALIKAKTTGIAGSTGGSLAETVVKMNSDLAEALFAVMISVAQMREAYKNENDPWAKAGQFIMKCAEAIVTAVGFAQAIDAGLMTKEAGMKAMGYQQDPNTNEFITPQEMKNRQAGALLALGTSLGMDLSEMLDTLEFGEGGVVDGLDDLRESIMGDRAEGSLTADQAALLDAADEYGQLLDIADNTPANNFIGSLSGDNSAGSRTDRLARLFGVKRNRPNVSAGATAGSTDSDGNMLTAQELSNPDNTGSISDGKWNKFLYGLAAAISGLGWALDIVGMMVGGSFFSNFLPKMEGYMEGDPDMMKRRKEIRDALRTIRENLRLNETASFESTLDDTKRNQIIGAIRTLMSYGIGFNMMIETTVLGGLQVNQDTIARRVEYMRKAFEAAITGLSMDDLNRSLADTTDPAARARIQQLIRYKQAQEAGNTTEARRIFMQIFNRSTNITMRYNENNEGYAERLTMIMNPDGSYSLVNAENNSREIARERMERIGNTDNRAWSFVGNRRNWLTEAVMNESGNINSELSAFQAGANNQGIQVLNINAAGNEDIRRIINSGNSTGNVNHASGYFRKGYFATVDSSSALRAINARGNNWAIGNFIKELATLTAMLLRDLWTNEKEIQKKNRELDKKLAYAIQLLMLDPTMADIALMITSDSQAQVNAIVSRHVNNKSDAMIQLTKFLVGTDRDNLTASRFQGSVMSIVGQMVRGWSNPEEISQMNERMQNVTSQMRSHMETTFYEYLRRLNHPGLQGRDLRAIARQLADQTIEAMQQNIQQALQEGRLLTNEDVNEFMREQMGFLNVTPQIVNTITRQPTIGSIVSGNGNYACYNQTVSIQFNFGDRPINVTVSSRPISDTQEQAECSRIFTDGEQPAPASIGGVTGNVRVLHSTGILTPERRVITSSTRLTMQTTGLSETDASGLQNYIQQHPNCNISFQNGTLIVTGPISQQTANDIKGAFSTLNMQQFNSMVEQSQHIQSAVSDGQFSEQQLTLAEILENQIGVTLNLNSTQATRLQNEISRSPAISNVRFENGRLIITGPLTQDQLNRLRSVIPSSQHSQLNPSLIARSQLLANPADFQGWIQGNATISRGIFSDTTYPTFEPQINSNTDVRQVIARIKSELTENPNRYPNGIAIRVGNQTFIAIRNSDNTVSFRRLLPNGSTESISQAQFGQILAAGRSPFTYTGGTTPTSQVRRITITESNGNALGAFNQILSQMQPGQTVYVTMPHPTLPNQTVTYQIRRNATGQLSELSGGQFVPQLDNQNYEVREVTVPTVGGSEQLSEPISNALGRIRVKLDSMDSQFITSQTPSGENNVQLRTITATFNTIFREYCTTAHELYQAENFVTELNNFYGDMETSRRVRNSVSNNAHPCRLTGNTQLGDLSSDQLGWLSTNRLRAQLRYYQGATAGRDYNLTNLVVEGSTPSRTINLLTATNEDIRQLVTASIQAHTPTLTPTDRDRFIREEIAYLTAVRDYVKSLPSHQQSAALAQINNPANLQAEITRLLNLPNRTPADTAKLNALQHIQRLYRNTRSGYADNISSLAQSYEVSRHQGSIQIDMSPQLQALIEQNPTRLTYLNGRLYISGLTPSLYNSLTSLGTNVSSQLENLCSIRLDANAQAIQLLFGTGAVPDQNGVYENDRFILRNGRLTIKPGALNNSAVFTTLAQVGRLTTMDASGASTRLISVSALARFENILRGSNQDNISAEGLSVQDPELQNFINDISSVDEHADLGTMFNEECADRAQNVVDSLVRNPRLIRHVFWRANLASMTDLANDSALDGLIHSLGLVAGNNRRGTASLLQNFPLALRADRFIQDTILKITTGADGRARVSVEITLNGQKHNFEADNYTDLRKQMEDFYNAHRTQLHQPANSGALATLRNAMNQCQEMLRIIQQINTLLAQSQQIARYVSLGMHEAWRSRAFNHTAPNTGVSFVGWGAMAENAALRMERNFRSLQLLSERRQELQQVDDYLQTLNINEMTVASQENLIASFAGHYGIDSTTLNSVLNDLLALRPTGTQKSNTPGNQARRTMLTQMMQILRRIMPGASPHVLQRIASDILDKLPAGTAPGLNARRDIVRILLRQVGLYQTVYSQIQINSPTFSGMHMDSGMLTAANYMELSTLQISRRLLGPIQGSLISGENITATGDFSNGITNICSFTLTGGNITSISFDAGITNEAELESRLNAANVPQELKNSILAVFRRLKQSYDRRLQIVNQTLYANSNKLNQGRARRAYAPLNIASYLSLLHLKDDNNEYIFPQEMRNAVTNITTLTDLNMLNNLQENFGSIFHQSGLPPNYAIKIKIGNTEYRITMNNQGQVVLQTSGGAPVNAAQVIQQNRAAIENAMYGGTLATRDNIVFNIDSQTTASAALQLFNMNNPNRAAPGTTFRFTIAGQSFTVIAGDASSVAAFRSAVEAYQLRQDIPISDANDNDQILELGNRVRDAKNLLVPTIPQSGPLSYQNLLYMQSTLASVFSDLSFNNPNDINYYNAVVNSLGINPLNERDDALLLIEGQNTGATYDFMNFVYDTMFPEDLSPAPGGGGQSPTWVTDPQLLSMLEGLRNQAAWSLTGNGGLSMMGLPSYDSQTNTARIGGQSYYYNAAQNRWYPLNFSLQSQEHSNDAEVVDQL